MGETSMIAATTDSTQELLGSHGPLELFFKPRKVAVIGATETPGSVGVFWNLVRSPFDGLVFPVNPNRPSVLGTKCYRSIGDVPAKAVVATPAATVPGVIGECAAAGVAA